MKFLNVWLIYDLISSVFIFVACLHKFSFLCPTHFMHVLSLFPISLYTSCFTCFVQNDVQEPCQFKMSTAEFSDFQTLG